jgi:hypothetical protein
MSIMSDKLFNMYKTQFKKWINVQWESKGKFVGFYATSEHMSIEAKYNQ